MKRIHTYRIRKKIFFLQIVFSILIFPGISLADNVNIFLKAYNISGQIAMNNSAGFILNKDNDRIYNNLNLKIINGKLYCNGVVHSSLLIETQNNNPTRFINKYGERLYDGSFNITLEAGRFYIINTTTITSYLAGVAGSELGESFSFETLKAQAVISRTYFLQKKKNSKFRGADISDTASIHQAYHGLQLSRAKSIQAVAQTEGQILYNRKQNFLPHFHSTCGGMLLTPQESWSGKPIEDIPGFNRYDHNGPAKNHNCKISPYYTWSALFRKDTIKNALSEQLNTKINNFRFIFNDHGFLEKVILTPGKDNPVIINGYEFRSFLERGWIKDIRSVRFNVLQFGPFLYFKGKGFGHFTGMCQWGAEYMARKGTSYKDILKFYYPDAVLVTNYTN